MRERTGGQGAGGWVVAGLLVAAAVQVVAFELVRRVFVDSVRGQWLDTVALYGNSIGRGRIEELVHTVLNAMTVVSLAVATIVIGFIALMRGRVLLAAVATLLIVGANLTTQLLKVGLHRPELGVDPERVYAGNSLPSGHATVAVAVAVALVLVLPPALRAAAGLIGAGYAALAGVATLSASWHRPSDAVAAMLVVGVWAALAGVVLAVADRHADVAGPPRPHRFPVATLALAGFGLLVVAAAAMALTYQQLGTPPEALGRTRLLIAYAGGASGIAGTAAVVMALVLASTPYVVRSRP